MPASKGIEFKSYPWQKTLSWAIPDTNCGMSTNSPRDRRGSRQLSIDCY